MANTIVPFEFEYNGERLRIDACVPTSGLPYTLAIYRGDKVFRYINTEREAEGVAFRALLANRAELAALYREAMDVARENSKHCTTHHIPAPKGTK